MDFLGSSCLALVVVLGRLVVVVVEVGLRVVSVVGTLVVVVVVVVVVFGRLVGRAGRSTTIDSATTPSNKTGSSSQINSSLTSTGVTSLVLYFLGGLGTWRRRDRPDAAVGVLDLMGAAVVVASRTEARVRAGATTGAATGTPAVTCRISVGAACRQFSQSSSTKLGKIP